MENDIPLTPVSGWTTGPVKKIQAVALKIRYISYPGQPVSESEETGFLALTPGQALALAAELQEAALKLQTS
jgi:hypothetical protein